MSLRPEGQLALALGGGPGLGFAGDFCAVTSQGAWGLQPRSPLGRSLRGLQSGDPACAWALTGPITAARPFQLVAFCLGLLCFFLL